MTVRHADLVGSDLHINMIHATTHERGATDPIPIDMLDVASDNVNLNASVNAHGLMPKLPNNSAEFFNGVGGWAIPGGVPTGMMSMWMTETPPSGWLECDGSSVLRTTYSTLFAVIGTRYGTLDSAHFNLPDLRGYFPRGWDHGRGLDPDMASRTDRGDGTTGDAVGTEEADAFRSHTHGYTTKYTTEPQSGSSTPCWYGTTPATTDPTGGNETRPININVMFIIKT